MKPTLKKVSKYDNKFRKAIAGEGGDAAAAAGAKPKEDFRAKLKAVEKKNVLEVLETKVRKMERELEGRRHKRTGRQWRLGGLRMPLT